MQVHYKIVAHWLVFKKVRPRSLLPLSTEIWHQWHHMVGLASPRQPLNTRSVCEQALPLKDLSPKPHCSIATAGNVSLGEPKDSSSGLMKRCEWNNWAGTGDYFCLSLFFIRRRSGIIFHGYCWSFFSRIWIHSLSGVRNKKNLFKGT